jgi:hypothetical protein
MTEYKSLRRATCYVERRFAVILAKKSIYDSFLPIGFATALPGEAGEILVLMDKVPFKEEQILHAYNASGYPEVPMCIKLKRDEYDLVLNVGYNEYLVRKLKGVLR